MIAEFPDNTTATAVSLNVSASGGASIRTTQLLEPEEIDAATKISVAYRAPAADRRLRSRGSAQGLARGAHRVDVLLG